jgi:hypothetical protein
MTYIVESRHTPEECLTALDTVLDRSPELLDKLEWGCNTGEHIGWAFLEGNSESDIRGMVPPPLLDKTRIVEVNKYTPDEIRSFHEK